MGARQIQPSEAVSKLEVSNETGSLDLICCRTSLLKRFMMIDASGDKSRQSTGESGLVLKL